MRIALLYEHPTWSNELIERARARGSDITPIDVGQFSLALPQSGVQFDLWVNRVNAMPSGDRPPSIVAAAAHLLLTLELQGQRVVNGSLSHRIGGSKTAQAALFDQLGLDTPRSIAIFSPQQAASAAETLEFPVLTKPNVGGSGSGILRHETEADLRHACDHDLIDLGIDGTGLVQQMVESADGLIHRVEMLGDSFFYGTEQPLQANAFNYCAADGCSIESPAAAIQLFTPSNSVIKQVAQLMHIAGTDVGGVEYIIDAMTGRPSFFDFNPYSNFISGFDADLGFNPIDRYLDFVLTRCE